MVFTDLLEEIMRELKLRGILKEALLKEIITEFLEMLRVFGYVLYKTYINRIYGRHFILKYKLIKVIN